MDVKFVDKLPSCVVCWSRDAVYETKTVLVDIVTCVCKACAEEVCLPEQLEEAKKLELKEDEE